MKKILVLLPILCCIACGSFAQQPTTDFPVTIKKNFNGKDVVLPRAYWTHNTVVYETWEPFVENDTTFIYREYEYYLCDTCKEYRRDSSSYYILPHTLGNHRENVNNISSRRWYVTPNGKFEPSLVDEAYYDQYKQTESKSKTQPLGDIPRIWYPMLKYNGQYYFGIDNPYVYEFFDNMIVFYGQEPYFLVLTDFKKLEGGGWSFKTEEWNGEVYEEKIIPCKNLPGAYIRIVTSSNQNPIYSLFTTDLAINNFDLIDWESTSHIPYYLDKYDEIDFKFLLGEGNEIYFPKPQQLTEAEAQTFIEYIPDHKLEDSPRWTYTKEYYNLLAEAWAIPSDNPGGIGSEEWLFYFLTGNGGLECNAQINNIRQDGDEAVIDFICSGEQTDAAPKVHQLYLHFDGNIWLIADFDNTKEQLRQYIQKQRAYFHSAQWNKDLKEMRHLSEKEKKAALDAVELYFAKYPRER